MTHRPVQKSEIISLHYC